MPGTNGIEPPALTVVIANHNYGKWISEAIMSVVADPYPRKQVIVVDDGSTDNSWEIISKTGKFRYTIPNDQQIYGGQKVFGTPIFALHNKKPLGPSAARNKGIRLGWNQSHVFGILDADDVYLPGKIQKSLERFVQDPQKIGGIYTDYDTISIDTGVRVRNYKEPFDRNRLTQECIIHSACIINKLALHTCGLYDESLRCCEDYHLWVRISRKFVFVHISEPLMLVRVHKDNSTNTVEKEIWTRCYQKVQQEIYQANSDLQE